MINNISKRELEELKKINAYTEENIKKLENNYPIQYIIGYVNFYGLNIKINESTLIPRYETEYLVEKTIKYLNKFNINNPKILDLCTGSGVIGLTLKKEIPTSSVTLSDISKEALEVAKLNSKELNLDVKIIESDLLKNINIDKYDLIISNPPYVMIDEQLPSNVLYEPKIALYSGNKGINHIEEIFKNIKPYMKDKSILALEINEKSEEDLTNIINSYFNDEYTYSFEKDLSEKTRYLFIFKNLNKN